TLLQIVGRGQEGGAAYTRAPKPGGRRGLDRTASPIEREARRFALPVFTPATLRTTDAADSVRAQDADVAVVVAYGLILPKPVLEAYPLGAFNLHASLLPRWRGAAPINRAIMAGDVETGGMGMEKGEGVDTRPIALAGHGPVTLFATPRGFHEPPPPPPAPPPGGAPPAPLPPP